MLILIELMSETMTKAHQRPTDLALRGVTPMISGIVCSDNRNQVRGTHDMPRTFQKKVYL
ncbi:MAG: hypothetical protein ACPGWR_13740 [Ardenticatenaceae bacterium]